MASEDSKLKSYWTTVSEAVIDAFQFVFAIIGDLFTGGLLMAQKKPMVYGAPLGGQDSMDTKIKMLAISERSFIVYETLSVMEAGTDVPYCTVSGLELPISGTNTMSIYIKEKLVCTVQSTSDSNGYVVYRGTGEKIGKVEKLDEDYAFYAEEDSTEANELTGLTKKPVYTLSGDFINRRFVMKDPNSKYFFNHTVAKVKKQVIAFPVFDHYTIRVAPGMDPILVLACTCIIDEELDAKIKQKAVDLGVSMAKTAFSYINPFGGGE